MKYTVRRTWCLWLPGILTGAVVHAASYAHSITLNGAGLLGLAVILVFTAALAVDWRDHA